MSYSEKVVKLWHVHIGDYPTVIRHLSFKEHQMTEKFAQDNVKLQRIESTLHNISILKAIQY